LLLFARLTLTLSVRIEHSQLEFTLTLNVVDAPHIRAQFKANTPPPAPAPIRQSIVPTPPPKKSGFGKWFSSSSSPQKPPRTPQPTPRPPPQPQFRLQENLARYMVPDGKLARALVVFKDIAKFCDQRQFECAVPLIGQRTEHGGKITAGIQIGELVLHVFRLPPLPVTPKDLPQSLLECQRGLEAVMWHRQCWMEGVLTQNGGDCTVRINSLIVHRSLLTRPKPVMASATFSYYRCQTHCVQ
jgi:hypothetical protein